MPYPMSTLWVTPALHWWIAPNDTQHNGWLCIPGSCIHCLWNLSWTFTWSCFDARCCYMNLIDSVYLSVLIQEYTHKVSQNRIALRAVLKRNASSGEAWHLIPRRSGWIPTFKPWSVIIPGDTQLILGVPGVNTTVHVPQAKRRRRCFRIQSCFYVKLELVGSYSVFGCHGSMVLGSRMFWPVTFFSSMSARFSGGQGEAAKP